jgi:ATP-dependent Clp protease protease subunit
MPNETDMSYKEGNSRSVVDYIESKIVSIYVNEFTEVSAKSFADSMMAAQKTEQKIIPVYIDSYGGACDALIVMMDLIEASKVPVATIAMGKAMSCGSVLLTCGAEGMRFIAPTARVMVHHVSSMVWGNVADLKVAVEETDRLQQVIFTKMAKNCQKPDNYFLDILKEKGNIEWFLTSQECFKHNVVNHVKLPTLKTEVTVTHKWV